MSFVHSNLLAESMFWLGPSASTGARQHDVVFNTLFYVIVFFFLLVVALMITLVVLYRRRNENDMPKGPTHSTGLELFWTGVPLGLVILFFIIGFRSYLDLEAPPPDAEVVQCDAQQFSYTFTYPNGAQGNVLYARVNRPTLLELRAKDVLHSVYIPAFRISRNAIPRRTERLWFEPTEPGSYPLFCTQYCGDGHSLMNTTVEVVDEAEYAKRLDALANIFVDPATKQPLPYAKVGEGLAKGRCLQCHSIDGAPSTGPTWRGLFKRQEQFSKAPEGFTIGPDDNDARWDAYLRESILDPPAKIVRGYQNVMPSYAGELSGSPYKDKMLTALVEYIKSLDNHGPDGRPKYYVPAPTPQK